MSDIPNNKTCEDCGVLTWRKDLGASDRFWHNGFVCKACCIIRIENAPGNAGKK